MSEDQADQIENEEAEYKLSSKEIAKREAALKQILQYGDPVLRSKALPVKVFDRKLKQQVKKMVELMDDAFGIGLAATQIGILNRVLTYRVDPEGEYQVLINPVILTASEEQAPLEEGCLSLPDTRVNVQRSVKIVVRALTLNGESREFEAEDLEARVIQHEVDHLDGKLIIDRCSQEERKEAIKRLSSLDLSTPQL